MLNLFDSVHSHCTGLDPALVETHFRRLPASYFERYAAAEIARHVRLLAGLAGQQAVEVEIRPLAAHAYEMVVVGVDRTGTVACITGALAAQGFDLEDVQVSSYLDEVRADGVAELNYFVIVLRMSGSLRGRAVPDFAGELRDRLRVAFGHLAQGRLLEAQAAAADTRTPLSDTGTPPTAAAGANRSTGYVGLVLGNDFRMDRKLAAGGMSEVYLATQISLDRTVAVKVFRHEGAADDEDLARFYQEALVLAQFSCAHIVQILAAGAAPDPSGGVLGWMAMEYMAGGDLGRWLQQHGSPPLELALRWLRQSLEGLQYAHRRAILHRDLKPHNLLLTADGDLKVSDFGLLKPARPSPSGQAPDSAIVGTLPYMSPEQAQGSQQLDERSDIFSLGTTFFYLLSGQLPFQKKTPAAILAQITQEDAPRLAEVAPHLPVPLAVIIGRMMARPCVERYQDVGVILEDLASYERRGLLSSAPSGTFLAAPLAAAEDSQGVKTQAYERPRE
jgi:hypothetical protein